MILLDVDGVIVKDYALLDHMKNNVVRYVSKKLPGLKKPHNVNKLIYSKYGHTAIGLSAEFNVDTRDFDEFVYDKYLIAHLEDYLDSNEEFERDANTIRTICDSGMSVSFFSNSPLVWTEPIRLKIDERIHNNGEYRKPKLESYLRFGKEEHFVFVDDRIENLKPVLFLENWTPIYFSNFRESHFIHTINDLTEIL